MVLLHAWLSYTIFFLLFTCVVSNCRIHLNKILNWGFLSFSRVWHWMVGCLVPHHFGGMYCIYSHLAHENKCSTFLQHIRNHAPIDSASHLRRQEFSVRLLWKLQDLQNLDGILSSILTISVASDIMFIVGILMWGTPLFYWIALWQWPQASLNEVWVCTQL